MAEATDSLVRRYETSYIIKKITNMERPRQKLNPNQYLNPYEALSKVKFRVMFAVSILLTSAFGITFSFWGFFATVMGYVLIEDLIYKKRCAALISSLFITAVSVIIFGVLIRMFGSYWGTVGILIFILLISAYSLWMNRDIYFGGMQHIETRIWGKPLENKYWKKNELKKMRYKLKV